MVKAKFKIGDYVIYKNSNLQKVFRVEAIIKKHPKHAYAIYNLEVVKYYNFGFTVGKIYPFNSRYIDDEYYVCNDESELLARLI